jgi:hypothetical protein
MLNELHELIFMKLRSRRIQMAEIDVHGPATTFGKALRRDVT